MELEGLIESGAVTLKPLEEEKEKEKEMGEEESETATAGAATDSIYSNQVLKMDTGNTGAGVSVRTDIVVAIESSDTISAAMAINSGDMELRNSENVLEVGFLPNSSIHPIPNIENMNENQNDNEKNNDNKNEKNNLSSFITIVEPELAILTFEEFFEALYPLNCPWSQRDDEVIAMFVNRVSDKLDLDPLMISSAVLENQRIISGLLPDRSSSGIQARYAALIVLNKVRTKLFVQFYLAVPHLLGRFLYIKSFPLSVYSISFFSFYNDLS